MQNFKQLTQTNYISECYNIQLYKYSLWFNKNPKQILCFILSAFFEFFSQVAHNIMRQCSPSVILSLFLFLARTLFLYFFPLRSRDHGGVIFQNIDPWGEGAQYLRRELDQTSQNSKLSAKYTLYSTPHSFHLRKANTTSLPNHNRVYNMFCQKKKVTLKGDNFFTTSAMNTQIEALKKDEDCTIFIFSMAHLPAQISISIGPL